MKIWRGGGQIHLKKTLTSQKEKKPIANHGYPKSLEGVGLGWGKNMRLFGGVKSICLVNLYFQFQSLRAPKKMGTSSLIIRCFNVNLRIKCLLR